MNKLLKLFLLLIVVTITFSCGDDLPIEQPIENKIGLICTAVLNDINNDELAQVDETITYTYTFKNLGDEKITNLKLNDERLGLVDYNIAINQLLTESEYSITFDYVIVQDDLLSNSIVNQTTITGLLPDETIVSDISSNLTYENDVNTEVTFSPYLGDFAYGYFVTNEGPFGSGTGTITYIADNGTVVQNAYQVANNGEVLGNIVQSMTINNDKAYIVVNNSHKIVVVNSYTLEKITVIEGDDINNPRNVVIIGNTAYVSNWGNASVATDDFIAVINLDTNEVTTTIPVGEGPDKMLVENNKIYVNLQGGRNSNQNNKVEVIDVNSNTVSSTITVGDSPNSIIKDSNDAIWVLCGGKPYYADVETSGKLIKIENDEVTLTLDFESNTTHPEHLTINGNDLIYTYNGNVFSTDVNSTELNTTTLDGLAGFYYSMNTKNNKLYVTNAGDFASEGTLKIFDLNDNSEIISISTGIVPGNIVFP